MARMRAPDDISSASFDGNEIAIGADGFAEVPDHGVAAMRDFGFILESEIPVPLAVEELTPQQKAAATKAARAAAVKPADPPAA